jgi:2-methylcitrate dehydratase PrpD
MSKRMHHGLAARNGLYAAGLAAHGYTGIKRVFEREYGGFLSVFGEGHHPQPDSLTSDLGKRWETQTIMKSYAAMGGLHGGIDAARQLLPSVRLATRCCGQSLDTSLRVARWLAPTNAEL